MEIKMELWEYIITAKIFVIQELTTMTKREIY